MRGRLRRTCWSDVQNRALKEWSAEGGSVSVKAFWLTSHTGNTREVIPRACFKTSTLPTKGLVAANEEICARVGYMSQSGYSGYENARGTK